MSDLWSTDDGNEWCAILQTYPAVIAAQGAMKLQILDDWYRCHLPGIIGSRQPSFVTRDELALLTEWKMARGVWRHRNLVLVRSNQATLVEDTSSRALANIPDTAAPISILSQLSGVRPATASAVVAAAAPEEYPFLDDVVAAQIGGIGKTAFTAGFYNKYSEAIRVRASQLGAHWTPTMVERAMLGIRRRQSR